MSALALPEKSLLDKSLQIYAYNFFKDSDTLTFLKEQFEQWKVTGQKPKTRIALLEGASLDDAIQHLKHRVPIFEDTLQLPLDPSVLYFDNAFKNLVGHTTKQCKAQWERQSNDILYAVVGKTKLKTSPDRNLYTIHTWCVDLQHNDSSDYKIYYLPDSDSFNWKKFTDRYESILRLIVGSAVAFGDPNLCYRIRCPLIGMFQHLKALTENDKDPFSSKKPSFQKAYDCFIRAVKRVFPLNAEWITENAQEGLEFTFCIDEEDEYNEYLIKEMQIACQFKNELRFTQEDLLCLPEKNDRAQDIVVDIWTKRTFIGNGGLNYKPKNLHSRMLMTTRKWLQPDHHICHDDFENDSYLHNHIFHPEMLQTEAIMVIPNKFLSRSMYPIYDISNVYPIV
eukprot:gene4612-5648_t